MEIMLSQHGAYMLAFAELGCAESVLHNFEKALGG
jgi:hypothetical protein